MASPKKPKGLAPGKTAKAEQGPLRESVAPPSLVYEETSMSFDGPLPPPDVLAAYDRALPGLAAKIQAAAAEEQRHRHALESKQLDLVQQSMERDDARLRLGIHCGLAVTVVGLVGALACIVLGHDAAGTVIATVDVVGLATVFVVQRRLQTKSKPSTPLKP